MEEIDVSKHTRYSLELIFEESKRLSINGRSSLVRLSERSVMFLTFYLSVVSFSFFKIIEFQNNMFMILFIGAFISSLIVYKNVTSSI